MPLVHAPSPLEPLRNLDVAIPGAKAEVLIKRDDLLGFSAAGNKGRLLEFLLGDARARGATTVVGCGPTTSNFVAALAVGAGTLGLATEIYIPGSITANPAIALAEAAGARVESVPVTRFEIDDVVAARARDLTAKGITAYGIPRGGATAVGAVGYALAAEELITQLGDRRDVVIVMPAGSCASAAGVLAGLTLLDSPHRLLAVSTNRPFDEAGEVLLEISRGVIDILGGAAGRPQDRLTLVDRAGGTTDEDLRNVGALLRASGLIAPDHYGPPTLTELTRAARTPLAETIVWWHTGGMLGWPRLLDQLRARGSGVESRQG